MKASPKSRLSDTIIGKLKKFGLKVADTIEGVSGEHSGTYIEAGKR